MLSLSIILELPKVALRYFKVKITTSIQAFMIETIGFLVHGVISPGVILWASSEARKPAVMIMRQIHFEFENQCSKIKEKFTKTKKAEGSNGGPAAPAPKEE